jgi:predicted Zn finger-like uncharacterized protein
MIIACHDCDSKFKVPPGSIGMEGRFVRCGDCGHEWLAGLDELLPDEPLEQESKELENSSKQVAESLDEEFKAEPEAVKEERTSDSFLDTLKIETEGNELAVTKESPKLDEPKLDDILSGLGMSHSEGEIHHSLDDNHGTMIVPKEEVIQDKTSFYERPAIVLLLKAVIAIALFVMIYLGLVYQRELITVKFPILERAYEFFNLSQNQGIRLTQLDCKISDTSESLQYLDKMELGIDFSIKNIDKNVQKISSIRYVVYGKQGEMIGSYTQKINKELQAGEVVKIEGGKLNHIPKNATFISIDIGNEMDIMLTDIGHMRHIILG